jgi:hypothetical protein
MEAESRIATAKIDILAHQGTRSVNISPVFGIDTLEAHLQRELDEGF